ncbi:hypothetical protein FC700_23810, partial [Bacillus mycoides]
MLIWWFLYRQRVLISWICVISEYSPRGFSCPHRFARLRLAPHPRWGQKPLMLFSLFFDLYP